MFTIALEPDISDISSYYLKTAMHALLFELLCYQLEEKTLSSRFTTILYYFIFKEAHRLSMSSFNELNPSISIF